MIRRALWAALVVVSFVVWDAPTRAAESATLAQRLAAAYPDSVKVDGAGAMTVRGIPVRVSSAITAGTVQERMATATIGDQFSIPYPAGCPVRTPAVDEDPGRLRNNAFFASLYGDSQAAVAKTLVRVSWFGSSLQATTTNGVDAKLRAVAADLAGRPELRNYLTKPGGGFNWRRIAGENVRSMHSYGIAFDINVAYSDYWRWSGGVKDYRNRIPCEIGAIFERHGFIWGAKWFHFDTMHFEYRPELLG
jgi:hypothetical protein